METFTEIKAWVQNPDFENLRRRHLAELGKVQIDAPIRDLIHAINQLPYCFTLQSCYGHFVYRGQPDPQNTDPLPLTHSIDKVEYRIAYLAICLDNIAAGKEIFDALQSLTDIDPENVQFGCAEWFWKYCPNSYVLQVEPRRFRDQDRAMLNYRETLHIESVRNTFFTRLSELFEIA